MAESPVLTVARLLGGVVLLNGNLGHQVLGQLLITNSNEVAIAGAAAAVAATSGQRNAAAQIAIRTAVPALAVRALLLKQEQRIERRETLVAERERQVAERAQAIKKSDEAIRKQATQITQDAALKARLAALEAERQVATATIAALETQNRELLSENRDFRTDVVRQSGLNIGEPYRPATATTDKAKTSAPRRPRKPRKPKA